MIEVKRVRHSYRDRLVLDDIQLTMTERRVAIIGSNGSGKSTFARLLNGLLIPSEGQVLVDGLDTRKEAKAIRQKVGFMFQDPDNQIVFPLVEEDVAFGLKNLRLPKRDIDQKVQEVLSRYGLAEYRQHPSHLLSGGQKQLLAISSVLVMNPSYIVFDEPTTLLDLRNKRMITKVIEELEQSAIVVSHDLDLVRNFERVIVFDAGRVVIDNCPAIALPRYESMMT